MSCKICNDTGWTCEQHPEEPFNHKLEDGERCGGPGDPCICNTTNPPWHMRRELGALFNKTLNNATKARLTHDFIANFSLFPCANLEK
jgi:hypothetical protein